MRTIQHRDSEIQSNGATKYKTSVSLYLCFAVFILFLATYLRFHNLGTQSLWNDEGSSYVQATRSFMDIASNTARDIHPPGYYWMLSFWRGLTGDSEFALRSLSAFASILTVAFTFALGKRLFNPVAGLMAALFVVLNTFSIYYAQEARMYALLALWGAAGMWVLSRQLPATSHQSKISGIVALGVINAAGLYTQYAYPFVMLAQGVIVVVWGMASPEAKAIWLRVTSPLKGLKNTVISPPSKTQPRVWNMLMVFILANMLAIILYAPWLPTAIKQITSWPSTGQAIPAGEAIHTIGGWFMYGLTYSYTTRQDASVLVIVLIAGVTLLAGGMGQWNMRRGRASLWRAALPVIWVIVPVGLFLLLGLFRTANLKLLLPSQVGFALFIGLGLARLWEGFRGWGMGGLLMSYQAGRTSLYTSRFFAGLLTFLILVGITSFLSPLYNDAQYQRSDYRGMVAAITVNPRPGDAIILDAPNQEEVFRYYYRGDAPLFALPPGLGGDDAETLAAVQDVMAHYQRIFVLFWGEAERDPNHVVENTLDSETFQAGEDVWYGDVRFAVYVPPAQMPAATAVNVHFGEHISLVDYALNSESFHPGDVLQTVLDWRTDALLAGAPSYKIFLQLLNSDGVLVAQRDTLPVSGSRPTESWQPDEIITDRQGLSLPADLPAGDYQLIVGLYEADNPSARLIVGEKDYLVLATIHVQ